MKLKDESLIIEHRTNLSEAFGNARKVPAPNHVWNIKYCKYTCYLDWRMKYIEGKILNSGKSLVTRNLKDRTVEEINQKVPSGK